VGLAAESVFHLLARAFIKQTMRLQQMLRKRENAVLAGKIKGRVQIHNLMSRLKFAMASILDTEITLKFQKVANLNKKFAREP
jgi:hypothetical protein